LQSVWQKQPMRATRWAVWGLCLVLVPTHSTRQTLEAIIYVSGGRLFSVTPDGHRGLDCVAPDSQEFGSPAWAPSGKEFVVEVASLDSARLARFDKACQLIAYLPQATGFVRPVWSHDGAYIYAINHRLRRAVGRWSTGGGPPDTVPIKTEQLQFQQVLWLAFDPTGQRAVMLVDGVKPRLVANVKEGGLLVTGSIPGGLTSQGEAVWLGNDELAVVGKGGDESTQALWRVVLSTGAVTRIGVPGLTLRDYVAHSAEHRSFVLSATLSDGSPERWSLWRFSPVDRHPERLTGGAEDFSPSWR
jgi:hypothetical protein